MDSKEIKYQYLPLPPGFIRVLDLHPGFSFSKSRHPPVQFTISIVSLASDPQYEALSYMPG